VNPAVPYLIAAAGAVGSCMAISTQKQRTAQLLCIAFSSIPSFCSALMADHADRSTKSNPHCSSFYDTAESRDLRHQLGVPKGYKSCAVVGSSGLLQRQRVAAEIDGHDMVMRFNMAPVDGYEHIVGGRTTLRMLNSEAVYQVMHCNAHAVNRSICPDYTVMLNTFRKDFAGEYRSLCDKDDTNIVDADPVLSNSLVTKLTPQFKHPMSGSVGIALALSVCSERVDVYGFTHKGTVRFNKDVPYHYYGKDEEKGFIDVLLDSLPETAKLLSELAAGEAHGCLHLDAPEKLHPLLKQTKVYLHDHEWKDPLSQPPGGCEHFVGNISLPALLLVIGACILICCMCCLACCKFCRPSARMVEPGTAAE